MSAKLSLFIASAALLLAAVSFWNDAPDNTQPAAMPVSAVAARPAAQNNPFETAAEPSADVAQLQTQLQNEINSRRQLESDLQHLRKRLARLESQQANADVSTDETEENETGPWFNTQALIDSGFDAALAEQLQQRFEDVELARLYLRDEARRDGWIGSERFREEMGNLDTRISGLREEFNDETYDAFLYAAGISNRVSVASVLSNSPAEQAGVQSGDNILRYDGNRLYSAFELTSATTQGNVGEPVRVDLERNGEEIAVYIPRGPLGIRLGSASVAPVNGTE